MNKCYKCGQEFEGQFCPNCGAKYEAGKTCPDCGSALDGLVNFCNHCGHRFDTYQNAVSQSSNTANSFEFGDKFYNVISGMLKWSPCVFFLLFAVLNFVFMGCSAYSVFGFDMGNVYKLSSGDYPLIATAIIVFCAISALFALAYPILRGKRAKLAHALTFVMYVSVFALSCVLYVNIQNGDWTVEVAPKLLVAFAVVFAVLSALSLIVDKLLSKRNEKYLKAKTAAIDKTQPSFWGKVVYNAKNWYIAHKKATNGTVIAVCSVAVVCVLIFAVIVPLATNIFTERKLSEINLGDSKEQVIKIIGEPYGGNIEANTWEYYGDEFVDLMKQQDEINKQMENVADLEQLAQLTEQQIKLDEKIANTTGRYIIVTFNNNQQVTSVTYDAKFNKLMSATSQKEVKSVTVGNKNTVDVVDISNNTVNVKTTYSDGSYRLSALPSNVQTSNFGSTNKNFPSSLTLAWSDALGEYSQNVKIDESNYKFDYNYSGGTLNLNGTIPTTMLMSFFNEELPWIDRDVNEIVFGADVTTIPSLSSLVKDSSIIKTLSVSDENTNYYSLSNIVFDKGDNVVMKPNDVIVLNDSEGNTFKKTDDQMPILLISSSKTDELILPYYNGGNYTVVSELANKYKTASFGQSELWTNIPELFFGGTYNNPVTIQSIQLPKNITSIASGAFMNCSSLTGVFYEGDIADWCNINFKLGYANPLCYAHNLYINNELVTNLVIPDTVTKINDYAFYRCTSIVSVTISENITSIGEMSFVGCSNLKTVYWNAIACEESGSDYSVYSRGGVWSYTPTVPDGYFVSPITTVVFGNNVISVPEGAFVGCNNLRNVYYAGDMAGWCNIGFASLYANPLYYAHNLFVNNEMVTGELVIPDTITDIKSYAFIGCMGITSVTIPSSVTKINYGAFNNCYKLVEVYNLSKLNISAGASANGSVAYYAKDVYTSLDETSKLTTTNDGFVFYCNDNDASLMDYIGNQTDLIMPSTFNGQSYDISDYAFYNNKNLTSVVMSDNVTLIGSNAFYNCYDLKNVSIGINVSSIGERAFFGCKNLMSITIPENVTRIEEDAFACCYKLVEVYNMSVLDIETNSSTNGGVAYYAKEVYISLDETSKLTTTDDGYIFYCTDDEIILVGYMGSKTELVLPSSFNGKKYDIFEYAFYDNPSITSVVISDGVKDIGNCAFRHCNELTSVTIPVGVTTISFYYVFGFDYKLLDVVFTGTIDQWKAIESHGISKNGVPATKVICSDGEVALSW